MEKQNIRNKIFQIDGYNNNKYNKRFPFEILCFANFTNKTVKVNFTNKTVKVRTEIKNGKSFCIYNDRVCNEKSTSVTKEIRPSRANCILVMGYNKESKYEIKYKVL